MAIKKVVVDNNTQVPMEYHVVAFTNVQHINNVVMLTILSFYSADAYAKSSRPLATEQVQLAGVPPRGTDLLDWVQAKLIELPADATGEVDYLNRFYLGGGEIVDYVPGLIPAPAAEPEAPAADPTPATTEEQPAEAAGDAKAE